MQISELSARSGITIPTIKYYLREGLLPPGRTISATRAEYSEDHVRRLALVRALIDLVGLPVAKVSEVLAVIDDPGRDPYTAVGRAVMALPPYLDAADRTPERIGAAESAEEPAAYPRAHAVITRLGWTWDPAFTAVAQLERALAAVEAAGMPLSDELLDAYGPALHAIAEREVGLGPSDRGEFLAYAVLGTALFEPVVLTLRRLAHQDVAARRAGP